jgi:hypothetical protein
MHALRRLDGITMGCKHVPIESGPFKYEVAKRFEQTGENFPRVASNECFDCVLSQHVSREGKSIDCKIVSIRLAVRLNDLRARWIQLDSSDRILFNTDAQIDLPEAYILQPNICHRIFGRLRVCIDNHDRGQTTQFVGCNNLCTTET